MGAADAIREILNYDPETGEFRWRERSVGMFNDGVHSAEHNCAKWNRRFAGSVAGTLASDGYLNIRVFDHTYPAHRLAWLLTTGEWPSSEIDHENLDRGDNRFANLREASRSQNLANTRLRSNNKSGLKGASWAKHVRKWLATIKKDGKSINLGYFDCPAAAHFAYTIAADKLFGEYARAA